MKRIWAVTLAVLLVLLASGVVLAQSETPAVDPQVPEPSSFLTLDMNAGFALDPFVVSLNGGGEVDAKTLDPACAGYINDKPVMTTHWAGAVDTLKVFYFSNADSTLVVKRPDGTYACADDVSENVLDAQLTLTNPVTGTYQLWVGNYDAPQLIPGLLVVTARPDVDLSNFDLSKLVQRPVIKTEPDIEQMQKDTLAQVTAMMDAIPHGAISADTPTITTTVVATGTQPAFMLNALGAECSGLISDAPNFVVDVPANVPNLRIFFEGTQDATLVVLAKDGGPYCTDNSAEDTNANPVIDIASPKPGSYGIMVGRFGPEDAITGTLTITTDPNAQPAILAPPAPVAQP